MTTPRTTMTKKERVRAALAGEPVDRVPVSLWGHDFLREWRPRELVDQTIESYRAADWDFIKFNPRATYFAEAWGNQYERPAEQHQPRLVANAVHSPAGLDGIRRIEPHSSTLGEHLYALSMLIEEVAGEVDVLHTVFSPLAVTAQLCGPGNEFIELARQNLAGAHQAVAAVCWTLSGYSGAAIEAGASGIFYAPLTWASRDTATEQFYREFGRPYDLRLLAGVRKASFNVLHVCRNRNMLDMLLDYPVAAFNWADHGEGNPTLAAVKERTSKAVMGGVDQTRLHEMTGEAVVAQVSDALSAGIDRLLLTGGCAIRPEATQEQRAAVARAVRG